MRGSSGFGRSFVAADNLAGRYGAIADVAACADFLVDSGVARPGQLGVSGPLLRRLPGPRGAGELPRAVRRRRRRVRHVRLRTFFAGTEPWIAAAAVSKYGDPQRDAELLRDLSPLTHIDRLGAPVLLIHGANDTNVPAGESEQVAEALAARGRAAPLPGARRGGARLPGRGPTPRRPVRPPPAWLTRHLAATATVVG